MCNVPLIKGTDLRLDVFYHYAFQDDFASLRNIWAREIPSSAKSLLYKQECLSQSWAPTQEAIHGGSVYNPTAQGVEAGGSLGLLTTHPSLIWEFQGIPWNSILRKRKRQDWYLPEEGSPKFTSDLPMYLWTVHPHMCTHGYMVTYPQIQTTKSTCVMKYLLNCLINLLLSALPFPFRVCFTYSLTMITVGCKSQ